MPLQSFSVVYRFIEESPLDVEQKRALVQDPNALRPLLPSFAAEAARQATRVRF